MIDPDELRGDLNRRVDEHRRSGDCVCGRYYYATAACGNGFCEIKRFCHGQRACTKPMVRRWILDSRVSGHCSFHGTGHEISGPEEADIAPFKPKDTNPTGGLLPANTVATYRHEPRVSIMLPFKNGRL
ncbi:hypothetical protein JX266_011627 [Neoarthrinium moseri]|uniref:uncharacterized protein n=1 Tax=Neoarthrinium moseri TaxID=1658444 RepID=UPI001FDDD907|nr:uncharacterized protein JN550_009843 [Neoarthrinium moseri]KAI1842219.1 hypothetical protein JX266_011627 [Neoarthrinium moseri]KAI1863107.1 hypothetical protein JN550_009843 [Neoarthrinium moseri]